MTAKHALKRKSLIDPQHQGKKLGLLGGGQLARMLAQAGTAMGLEVHVFSSSQDDPAAQVVSHWHQGEMTDFKALKSFFTDMDFITIESEFINEKIVSQVELATGKHITPSLEHVALFSDRLSQKLWLTKMKIPTAAFMHPQNENELVQFFKQNKKGIVLKKRRLGYDGYGTFILKSSNELKKWINKNKNLTDFIAEAFVPFKKELAIQFATNNFGECMIYPLVEWQAWEAKCLWVKGPIKNLKAVQLSKKIVKALKNLRYSGAIAFELFEGRSGLLVNEVAPRVHNSAHHTIESCEISQFQGHLMAVLNTHLPKYSKPLTKGFAMHNLIGIHPSNIDMNKLAHAHWHWYGKKEARPGRKMGHVTIAANSAEKSLTPLLKMSKLFAK